MKWPLLAGCLLRILCYLLYFGIPRFFPYPLVVKLILICGADLLLSVSTGTNPPMYLTFTYVLLGILKAFLVNWDSILENYSLVIKPCMHACSSSSSVQESWR